MNIIFVVSLYLICISSLLHLLNDFFAVGIFQIVLAFLLAFASLKLSTHSSSLVAGLLALAISSLYLSIYLWLIGGEFVLISDAELYDQLARDIAYTVPLHVQLNPFALEYVYELGLAYAVIAQPGYYKILGLAYTFAHLFGLSNVSIQVPLIINLLSFMLIGYVFHKLVGTFAIPRKMVWVIWCALMLNPYLLEQLVWLRKDLFTLIATLAALSAIVTRSHFLVIASLIMLVAALRLPYAALAVAFYVFYTMRARHPQSILIRLVNVNGILLALFIYTLVFVLAGYVPKPQIAPENLPAYLADLPTHVGASSILLSNDFGLAIYGILYPFPSLFPQDAASLVRSIFAYLYLLLLAVTAFHLRNMQRYGPFMYATAIMFILSLAGSSLMAIVTWNSLGFVVFEARYKLLTHALLVILFAGIWAELRNQRLQLTAARARRVFPRGADIRCDHGRLDDVSVT